MRHLNDPVIVKPKEESAMSVYYIAQMDISNPDLYKTIGERSSALIKAHKGVVLAADSNFEVLTGKINATRIIIIQFPSEEALKSWYNSAEYEELKVTRDASAVANVAFVHAV